MWGSWLSFGVFGLMAFDNRGGGQWLSGCTAEAFSMIGQKLYF